MQRALDELKATGYSLQRTGEIALDQFFRSLKIIKNIFRVTSRVTAFRISDIISRADEKNDIIRTKKLLSYFTNPEIDITQITRMNLPKLTKKLMQIQDIPLDKLVISDHGLDFCVGDGDTLKVIFTNDDIAALEVIKDEKLIEYTKKSPSD